MGGGMKSQSILDMLQQLSKRKLVSTLSADDTRRIDKDINERMKEVDIDFKQRNAKSQLDASKIFLTF